MLNLIHKDFKELIHNKKVVIFSILLPLLLFGFIYFLYEKTEGSNNEAFITLGVVDKDDNFFSRLLVSYFKENETFSNYFSLIEGTKEEIYSAFAQNEINAYIEIPKDFVEKMQYMEHEPIKVCINSSNPLNTLIIKNILNGYEKYIASVEIGVITLGEVMTQSGFSKEEIEKSNLDISFSLVLTALGRNQLFEFIEGGEVSSKSLAHYYIQGILALVILYSGLYVGMNVLREKKENTFDRLLSIGYPIIKIILSKVFVHTLFLFALLFFTYIAVSVGLKENINLLIAIFYLTAIFFSVSFSFVLGGILKSEEGIMFGGNVIYFFIAILGGSIIPIEYLPSSLSKISKLMPNYWFIKTGLTGSNNSDLLIIVIIITACLGLLNLLLSTVLMKKEF